jgi:acyl-CoA thioester hydrolase
MNKVAFEVPIYTFHIDFAGHVSNIVYVQWMEAGRQKLFEAAGLPLEQLAETGIVPVLAHTEIDYKLPLLLGDRARVEVWASELRRASARVEYRFYREDVLVASGSQKGLFVDRGSMRPVRVPPDFRTRLEPFLAFEKA